METDHNGTTNQDDSNATGKQHDHREGTEETNSGINKDLASEERIEENREDRQHHEEHGNRKYKMFKNHSSADDQTRTNTGPQI